MEENHRRKFVTESVSSRKDGIILNEREIIIIRNLKNNAVKGTKIVDVLAYTEEHCELLQLVGYGIRIFDC